MYIKNATMAGTRVLNKGRVVLDFFQQVLSKPSETQSKAIWY